MLVAYCIYTEEVNERVFTPQVYRTFDYPGEWESNEEIEWVDGLWELTEQGEELVREFLDDYSCGYDLCYGRMKGLADKYSYVSFFEMIISNNLYSHIYE